MSKIALIGGSGIYNLNSMTLIKEHDVETPFGKPSSKVKELELDGHRFFFIPRHGESHEFSPLEVNYRANIYALKLLGVSNIVSVSAVGSLKEEHFPTKFVLPTQFIDWTKGLRKRTFFENGIVGHVSVANPIELELQKRIDSVLKDLDIDYSTGGSYICIEGPQFSTKAESEIYRSFGADVIGMTNVPEAYLSKEAGIAYATVAMVTDYDCWKEEHCSVEEIMNVMKTNNKSAQVLIKSLIPSLVSSPVEFEAENKFAVVTKAELISNKHKQILDTLLK